MNDKLRHGIWVLLPFTLLFEGCASFPVGETARTPQLLADPELRLPFKYEVVEVREDLFWGGWGTYSASVWRFTNTVCNLLESYGVRSSSSKSMEHEVGCVRLHFSEKGGNVFTMLNGVVSGYSLAIIPSFCRVTIELEAELIRVDQYPVQFHYTQRINNWASLLAFGLEPPDSKSNPNLVYSETYKSLANRLVTDLSQY